MNLQRTVLTLMLVAGGSPAFAMSDAARMTLASNIGNVLASEEPCGLRYDQDAIAAWIEKKVPADDMDWPGMLNLMVSGSGAQIEDMSPSAKTAHCTQIRRVAKSFGFIH